MATKTKIIFTLPDGVEQKYSIDRAGIYHFGTADSCDITLDDPALEETHGKLVADETNEVRWFLQTLEDGAISVLEDGSEQQIGNTHLQVSVTEENTAQKIVEKEEDKEPVFVSEDPVDNQDQLENLQKAQKMRELKSALIMIVVCGILAFAAGVAWRLMRIP
jgi:hypothetical protein